MTCIIVVGGRIHSYASQSISLKNFYCIYIQRDSELDAITQTLRDGSSHYMKHFFFQETRLTSTYSAKIWEVLFESQFLYLFKILTFTVKRSATSVQSIQCFHK